MFNREIPSNLAGLQEAIDQTLTSMKGETPGTDDYAALVTQLDTLYKLKDIDRPRAVDRATLVTAGANLIGILTIVNFERANIVTSKAINLLLKLK